MTAPQKPKPLWLTAKEHEHKLQREELRTIDDVLVYHELAAGFPEGSDARAACLAWAHKAFLEYAAAKRTRGGQKKRRDLDDFALASMDIMSGLTGEKSAEALAREAIEAGQVPNKASMESRVKRLARKYGRYKRKPRALNLETASHYSSDGSQVECRVEVPLSKNATAEEREAAIERAKLSLLRWLLIYPTRSEETRIDRLDLKVKTVK